MSVTQTVASAKDMALGKYEQSTETIDEVGVVAGMAQKFQGIVVAAVTLIIGLLVYAEISESLPSISNPELSNASRAVDSNVGTAFQLGAVAILVAGAVVILGLINGGLMSGGNNGGSMR